MNRSSKEWWLHKQLIVSDSSPPPVVLHVRTWENDFFSCQNEWRKMIFHMMWGDEDGNPFRAETMKQRQAKGHTLLKLIENGARNLCEIISRTEKFMFLFLSWIMLQLCSIFFSTFFPPDYKWRWMWVGKSKRCGEKAWKLIKFPFN